MKEGGDPRCMGNVLWEASTFVRRNLEGYCYDPPSYPNVAQIISAPYLAFTKRLLHSTVYYNTGTKLLAGDQPGPGS